MTREERIREATQALMDAVVSVELSHDLDPYPGTIGEVADEIADKVAELEASGVARGLVGMVRFRLEVRQSGQVPGHAVPIVPEPPKRAQIRAVDLPCGECLEPDEDPLPWCDCVPGETCSGPCRRRAHQAGRCPE